MQRAGIVRRDARQASDASEEDQMLTDALQPMLRKIMKFRRESMDVLSRAERSVREHRGLYEAIAAGERDRAESLMTHHVDNARQSILDACRE